MIPTEQDYRDYAEHLGFMWDEGAELDQLVHFEHDGKIIVSPYSYVQAGQNPAEVFGESKMDQWKLEVCRKLFCPVINF